MRRWLVGLAVLVLLGGCDLTGSRGGRDTGTPARPQADTAEDVGTSVTAIRVGNGTVTFTVRVPGGPSGCAGKPQAQVVGYDRTKVTVNTVVPSNLDPSCRGYVSRSFTTNLDLQGRDLFLNGTLYSVGADGKVDVCVGLLGCHPPPDRCDPEWTSRVIPHYDLPPAKSTRVVSCHAHWLVLDVKATANSGAVQFVRWFAELDPQRRWLVVASTRTGGCVDVRLAVPSFPVVYCRNLKPPGVQRAS